MKDAKKDALIEDAIMERPLSFKIDDEVFYIYPMTLGKAYIMQRIVKGLGINEKFIQANTSMEMLRVIDEKRDDVCELLAYMTARNEYYDVFDVPALEKRKKMFSKQPDSDLASLLVMVMTADKTGEFSKYLGIDEEQQNAQKVMKVKEKTDKNSFTFGGVSLFGSLLDAAMERYKMSKRQVVWEIDYTSLRLLLADRVNSMYVSDEERKKIHISKEHNKINGDDKEELMNAVKSMSWA